MNISIPPLDDQARQAAARRLDSLAKPVGSLGRLEELAQDLAAMTGSPSPSFPKKAAIVMAADHGVVAEGVSAFPSSVTQIMVENFLQGGAAINVLARQAGADLVCVDMGVAAGDPARPDAVISADPQHRVLFFNRKVRPGTRNFALEPAMEPDEALAAIETGRRLAAGLIDDGYSLFSMGEMGIGNTTASAAIIAALTGSPAGEVVGPGAGLSAQDLPLKQRVVEQSLALHGLDDRDPFKVLVCVGGLEIAGMAGFIIEAAHRRVPTVVDGVISGAAALLAEALVPGVKNYLIPGHLSAEPGHTRALEHLGMTPYLQLNMRLGEGTGAVLAFFLIEAACRLLSEMATLESLGIKPTGD